jgi:4-hydroxyphenylpyruvate dioxygenase
MGKLVGFDKFLRSNPMSDRFEISAFHHVEFVCSDAQTTVARWAHALGMHVCARSDLSTGNARFASHVLRSGSIRFVFTAPTCDSDELDDSHPSVTLSPRGMHE